MTAVVRGCGTREPGGIYLVCDVGEDGKPVDHFLIDPPRRVEPEALGLASRGVALAEVQGLPCVLDWVGADSYPNVADFVEEVARFGSSRRVQQGFDFAALLPGSRHLFVHPRALIANVALGPGHAGADDPRWIGGDFPPDALPGRVTLLDGGRCVTRRAEHDALDYQGMCATYWWQDLDPVTLTWASDPARFEAQARRDEAVRRQMPGFAYHAFARPEGWAPNYRPAAFLWLPIHRLVVVNDPEGGRHEGALEKAARAGLPVALEED